MTLANRLALLFALIVLGAIAVVYVAVAPQLEDSLREQKLQTLAENAERDSRELESATGSDIPQAQLQRRLNEAGERSSARVTLFNVTRGATPRVLPILDSVVDCGRPVDCRELIGDIQFGVADEALATGQVATGTEPTDDGRIAEAAWPIKRGSEVVRIVVFSDSLEDVTSNVTLIRQRILVAGAIALVLSVAAGYIVARALSRRVERLEQAARKVAVGDFSQRIEVDSDDELGRLAAAFDDMQRQLAQLDDARKQFIATASHELRTPIFSLGGFLELLADEELDDDTRREFVVQLQQQVERLRKLAVELLDLSRMESGSLELHPEPTDLTQLVRDVTDEFAPALRTHRSNLLLDLPEEGLEAECDPDRVAQVMRILIDNAVVHTPEGTGIVVSAARSNGTVSLEVADRGLGIQRQTMTQIFEPFFKADQTPGAGLGLAIARELAERMDGRLGVVSSAEETRFCFELPA